jgi:hypothetical protein
MAGVSGCNGMLVLVCVACMRGGAAAERLVWGTSTVVFFLVAGVLGVCWGVGDVGDRTHHSPE